MCSADDAAAAHRCHVIINLIVAFFIAPVGHWFARPGDFKSLSFMGTCGAWIIGWPFSFTPIVGFLGWLLVVAAWIWASFVCVVSEKNRSSGQSAAVEDSTQAGNAV